MALGGEPIGDVSRTADLALIDRLRSGDQAAFRTLVQQHHGGLLRVAQQYVSSSAVAEEVVQDTWLAVIKGLRGFEGRSSLKTWIYRILMNIARTRGVREQRTVPFSSLGSSSVAHEVGTREPAVDPGCFRSQDHLFNGHWSSPPTGFHRLPEELLLSRDVTAAIEAAITRLPGNQQRVVWLRDVEGWTSGEVCEALSISDANQRVLLHRARSTVRAMLERQLAVGVS